MLSLTVKFQSGFRHYCWYEKHVTTLVTEYILTNLDLYSCAYVLNASGLEEEEKEKKSEKRKMALVLQFSFPLESFMV